MELHTTMSYCGSEMHQLSVRMILIRCCLGSRRGLHAKFQTKKSVLNYTGLVPRYQMHKCGAYCKRKRKCSSGTFVTRCRFGFPRQACESAKLNSVSDSLKSRKRIYQLPRGDTEVRVNDYNPSLIWSIALMSHMYRDVSNGHPISSLRCISCVIYMVYLNTINHN